MFVFWNDGTELYHYGISGQKWGIRRWTNSDGTLNEAGKDRYNKNYSEGQRKRDESIYGKGGVRRINRAMNKGMPISGARTKEAERIAPARKSAKIGGYIGAGISNLAFAGMSYISSGPIQDFLLENVGLEVNRMVITGALSGYAASTVTALGKIGGQSVGMLLAGYEPSKYRT